MTASPTTDDANVVNIFANLPDIHLENAEHRLDAQATLRRIGRYDTVPLCRLYQVLKHAEHVWIACINMPCLADLEGVAESEMQRTWEMRRLIAAEISERPEDPMDKDNERRLVVADWTLNT